MRHHVVLSVVFLGLLMACSDDPVTPPTPPEPLPLANEHPAFVKEWDVPTESMDIAVSSSGRVFLATFTNGIREYSGDGASLGTWKPLSHSGEQLAPVYLEFARTAALEEGSFYVVSGTPQPSRIVRFDVRKSWSNEWAEFHDEGGYAGGVDQIAVSPSGDVYRLRYDEGTVVKYKPSGEFEREWEADDAEPEADNPPGGIAATDKVVYVADSRNDRILMFSPMGEFLGSFGGPGAGPGKLGYPGGLAIQGDVLFVVELEYRRVQTFTLDGKFGGGFGTRDFPRLVAVQGRSIYVLVDNKVQHYRYE